MPENNAASVRYSMTEALFYWELRGKRLGWELADRAEADLGTKDEGRRRFEIVPDGTDFVVRIIKD